jgi:hypothetical protein
MFLSRDRAPKNRPLGLRASKKLLRTAAVWAEVETLFAFLGMTAKQPWAALISVLDYAKPPRQG